MQYKELIQFDPIERIIQIRDANEAEHAKRFVSTYVFSDVMAEKLRDLVFPLLRPDAVDAKGLLIVGNYGTGKSHLMSVISALSEHGDLLDEVSNETVKEAAGPVAGKYRVVRMEIGSTKMGLRQIITQNIEKALRDWEIDFKFPKQDEVSENKTSFENLMGEFAQTFPEKGLLVVVDELLDYLRTRDQQELTLDLGFLREIGEVCKDLRFRFIAGIQEAIFDSDRFAFVSESLLRVKDRFDQVRILKTDITFVVANRLLKKSEEQKRKIRDYLEPFSKFYEGWSEELDTYVDLFPVHPDYVSTFERLPIVEQRGVLQVLSLNFKAMMDEELPAEYPGLLALDSFWAYLKDNAVHRSNDDVRATMDCSDTLLSKVESGFPKNRQQYKGIAKRIIEGLSVNRLTSANINAPIGMTTEQIRDELCLYHPMIEDIGCDPAEDLLATIEVALKEIRACVSGQFLSQNDDNRQYYLDLKKTEDFDALVEKRAETLGKEELDLAYFDVLQQLMEIGDQSDFTGFRIWESSMPWEDRNVTKLGWLFFGVPSERSTAQPARDFYLYFPQIINPPKYKDEQKADEVFFKLDTKDGVFTETLRLYAAALALKHNATGAKKQEYHNKAEKHFIVLRDWLRQNFLSKIKVTFGGKTKSLSQALTGGNAAGKTCREQVFLAASRLLNRHFEEICGDYPRFTRQITFGKDGNAPQAITDALKCFHGTKTQTGAAVLDGLSLYDGEKIDPTQSPYANYIIEKLNAKGHGQVLNQNELISEIDTIPYFFAAGKFRLEVELLIVVLGALVYSGEIVLSIPGKEFSATDLGDMAARPLRDFLDFKHIKQPKDWNIPAIKALFELLGLPSGLAVQVSQNNNEAVTKLNIELNKRVETLVLARQEFSNGIPFWGMRLLGESEIADLATQIDATKDFLESLQAFNTPGKLKNFKYSADDINKHKPGIALLESVDQLKQFADSLADYTSYLSSAEGILPEGNEWREKSRAFKENIRADVLKPENRSSKDFRKKTLDALKKLKQEYIDIYLQLYKHSRLDLEQDKRKKTLVSDVRMDHLNALSTIETMNVSQLKEIRDEFGSLQTGQNITADDLQESATAADFFPLMESNQGMSAEQRLNNLESQIGGVYSAWVNSLLKEFEDPIVQDNMKLLKADEKAALDAFLIEKELPNDLPKPLIPAMKQALSGLSRVSVKLHDLEGALFAGGSATTIEDFKDRFTEYLDGIIKGQDRSKVRLVLDKNSQQ